MAPTRTAPSSTKDKLFLLPMISGRMCMHDAYKKVPAGAPRYISHIDELLFH